MAEGVGSAFLLSAKRLSTFFFLPVPKVFGRKSVSEIRCGLCTRGAALDQTAQQTGASQQKSGIVSGRWHGVSCRCLPRLLTPPLRPTLQPTQRIAVGLCRHQCDPATGRLTGSTNLQFQVFLTFHIDNCAPTLDGRTRAHKLFLRPVPAALEAPSVRQTGLRLSLLSHGPKTALSLSSRRNHKPLHKTRIVNRIPDRGSEGPRDTPACDYHLAFSWHF